MATLDNDDKKWLKKNFTTKDDIKKINKKLDQHFNFMDRDVSYFRRKTADLLGVPVSELIERPV